MTDWQRLYDSPWHIPALPWVASLLLVVHTIMGGQDPRRRFFAAFAVLIALDAGLTGALAPPMPAALGTFVAVAFVVLGDFRFFYLALAEGTSVQRPVLVATALSFVVPVLSQVLRLVAPDALAGGRALFLAYELAFLGMLGGFVVATGGAVKNGRLLRTLAAFEAVQYGLWATADVLILGGRTIGFGLRIIPNVAYYAGFLWFAYWQLALSRPSGKP